MRSLNLKFPPMFLTILIMAFMVWPFPTEFWQGNVPQYLALVVALLAGGILFSCALNFYQAKTTVNPLEPNASSTLVVRGLYRFSRNPMYVGFAFLIIATALFFQRPSGVFWTLFLVGYLTVFQIKPEEQALVSKFGDDYRHYCQQVRRWL